MQDSLSLFLDTHRHSDDAQIAHDLVRTAGQLALQMRQEGITTEYKTSISDVVTDADKAAENLVSKALAALRPDDGILGEEGTQRASQSGRTWVIDPVDGTYNFTSGSDYWCSAVALVHGDTSAPDRIELGAVHRPTTDQTWIGGPELPTTCNGAPLNPLAQDGNPTADAPLPGLAEVSLGTYLHPSWMQREEVLKAWLSVAKLPATIRMFGAASVDLALLASGTLGGWLQHSVKDWDWLPGAALVSGVGGTTAAVEAGGVTWKIAGTSGVVSDISRLLIS
ncbi:inositol monophosphatase [Corynebacterium sp. 3HC-13]|uniref:inositol monophosphatase family protein n=1 Tax=Corynebacterium poyangense TaxID=2684405 RepID=UPI001CCDA158|nr:inositol monophosphatase family protein [Corynebacterium poyangense]MBZ8176930.1 inositol monophosphatase [Corynebacterium poyangense]